MALYRGGEAVDDPKAWLDSLDPEVITLWESYYRIEPFGGEYQRHAAMMETMEAMYSFQVNRHIPKEKSHLRYKPRRRRDFMPADYAGERPVPPQVEKPLTLDQQLTLYKSAFRKR